MKKMEIKFKNKINLYKFKIKFDYNRRKKN